MSESEDAAKWRALVACQRVRVVGSAGLAQLKQDGCAHLGLELWTEFPFDANANRDTAASLADLERFIEIARTSRRPSPERGP